MDYKNYTERQGQILGSEIPIVRVTNHELKRLRIKALLKYDFSAAKFVSNELEMRGVRFPKSIGSYSRAQKNYLKWGDVPMSEVRTDELKFTYNLALDLCDKENAEKIDEELRRRGPVIHKIDGYSPAQLQLIWGQRNIEEANDRTVSSLADMAEKLCDTDIAEFAIAEVKRRGLMRYRRSVIDTGDLTKKSDLDLCRMATEARASGNPLLQSIEDEVERRNTEIRDKYYSEHERDIIARKLGLEGESIAQLEQLMRKLKIENHETLIEMYKAVEKVFDKKETRKKKMSLEYTERQLSIILGDVPMNTIRVKELNTLVNKAVKRREYEIANYFIKIIEERDYDPDSEYDDVQQMIINTLKEHGANKSNKKPKAVPERKKEVDSLSKAVEHLRDKEYYRGLEYSPYTPTEQSIADGMIPLKKVSRKKLGKLVRKARRAGDEKLADRLEMHLAERNRFNPSDRRDVISGKMPYEEIPTKLLFGIRKKAKASGDTETLELVETLIYEKYLDSEERKTYGPSRAGEYERKNKSPHWAQDVLDCIVGTEECTMTDLQNIRLYATTLDDPAYVRIAEFYIAVRKDESILYPVKTDEEARALLAELTIAPLLW